MFAKIALLAAVACVAKAGVLNAGYGYAAAPALGYGLAAPALAATPVYRTAPAAQLLAAPAYGVAKVAAAPVLAAPAIGVAKAVIAEAPQPYEFGYSHHSDDGGASSRQEISDGGNNKQGSYSIQNPDGTYRHVSYVADAAGFRAVVKTNEHGTAPQNPAATQVLAEEPPYKVLPAPAPIVKTAAIGVAPVLAKAAVPAIGLGYAGGYIH